MDRGGGASSGPGGAPSHSCPCHPVLGHMGIWDTPTHAARLQGTFFLTTACEKHGCDATENVYYAAPGNVAEMRRALESYLGCRKVDGVQDADFQPVGNRSPRPICNAIPWYLRHTQRTWHCKAKKLGL